MLQFRINASYSPTCPISRATLGSQLLQRIAQIYATRCPISLTSNQYTPSNATARTGQESIPTMFTGRAIKKTCFSRS